MHIAIITVKRDPTYIHETMASLDATAVISTGIHMFAGSPDASYLDCYDDRTGVVIHEMSSALWRRIEPLPTGQRAAGNFLYALKYLQRSAPKDPPGVLLIEDDVIFKPGWPAKLMELILDEWDWSDSADRLVKAQASDAFVSMYIHPTVAAELQFPVLLNEAGDVIGRDVIRGRGRYIFCPPVTFFGSLALFIPQRHIDGMIRLLNDNLENPELPFDAAVMQYCNTRGVPIVFPSESFVDHIGDVSAIQRAAEHGPRRSPMF